MIDYMEWRRQKLKEGWFDCGMFLNPKAKTTKVKPVKSTIALYQSLEGGMLRRKDIVEVLFTVAQDKPCPPRSIQGYMTALISYHFHTGRLAKTQANHKVFYSLTEKGREYAKERGIF
jgi:hypothetical protein